MHSDPGQLSTRYAKSLLGWYQRHGRHALPWQIDKTTYRVWLSEIMLQQTQVTTVIPYYLRFIEVFPDIESLADASIDEVLQHWQGLGYYARARNLHRAAQIMRDDYQGQFPQELGQVMALPGIGRSTAGAILTFACGQSWPILDGNVKRVLARNFQVSGWYGQSQTMKRLWQIADQLTPAQSTADYNQAMMDLGAMVCLKTRPKCEICPLDQYCMSYQQGTQASYPEKKPAKPKPQKQTLMLLHRYQGRILLYRRPPTGIWGGLWSLPEVVDSEGIAEWQTHNLASEKAPNTINTNVLKHQFTHFSLDISLAVIDLEEMPSKVADEENMTFVTTAELSKYGLPTPVRKLLSSKIDTPFFPLSPAGRCDASRG
jgi:A/G-specific adenine glycosylase